MNTTASWVIIRLSDNAVIAETFSKKIADAVNTEKYKAVPILEHLQSLNRQQHR